MHGPAAPQYKLAVVEYATELLLEETESQWDPNALSPAVVLGKQRAASTSASWRSCCRGCCRASPTSLLRATP